MFVRIVKAKDKKYAQVVESFRNGKQVSHRVLWSLGRYDEPLARSVSDRLRCWKKLERAAVIIQEVEELDCTGFAGHVEKTYNEVKGRVRNYEREQISQKV